MKPMKGKGPKKAPTAPKAPGMAKKGKYQSKTGNVECSNAMSVWQKALHAGITPGKQVYDKLAQCRASVRTNKQNAGKVAAGSMKQSAASAVSNRSDRRIATNTATTKARKERLKELVQARASRNISTADRQKAMDTAAKVTGNQTGPSAGLRRLQGVRATRRSTSPAATVPPASRAATPAASTPRTRRAAAPRAIPDAGQTNRSLTPKQPVVPLNPPGFNRFAQHRADAAALLRNMRATGRRDEAANLRGFSKASLMTRIGIKSEDVRNYTGGTIMDIASKNKIGIQPVKPPPSKAAALVAKVRQSGNHAGNRWDAGVNKRMVSAGISARTGPQIPANVLQARQSAPKTPIREARSPEIVAQRSKIAADMRTAYRSEQANPGHMDLEARGPAFRDVKSIPKVGYRNAVNAAESGVENRFQGWGGNLLNNKNQTWIRMEEAKSAGARMAMRAAIARRDAGQTATPTPEATFTPLPRRERTYKPFGQGAAAKKSFPDGQKRGSNTRKTQIPAIKERLETLRTNRAAAAGAIPISFKKQTPKGFTANLITGVSGNQFPIAVKPVRRDTGIQTTSSRGDFRVVQPSTGMIALPNMLKRDQATRAARAMDYLAERASRGGGDAQGLEALRSRPDYYKIVKRWADRQSYNPSAKKGR